MAARFTTEVQTTPLALLESMGDTDLLHCDLDIEVSNLNPAANQCTITGSNTMTIRSNVDSLSEFTFRLRSQFTITNAWLNGTIPVTVDTASTTTRVANLDPPRALNEEFTLTIEYTGDTVSRGFGSIEVANQFGNDVVATLSEPYYAYTWWPVKDGDVGVPGDNSDKFTLDFSITAPNDFIVPANGALVSVEDLGGGRHRHNWSTSYPTVTYLVSFAATIYNTWTVDYIHPGGTMPVEFYIYPGRDTPQNRAAWELVVDMLDVFGNVYGEYPFIDEKYGIYNFPFGGGMEHQTITGQGGFSEALTSHELAHQWWGDMVTCETWSDIWLNEGFAEYSECLWYEQKSGSLDAAAYFAAVQARRPFDAGQSVYVPAEECDSIARIFSSNSSYRKGCWVLHQLRGVVGDATFFDILADYRSTCAFSSATTEDFIGVASGVYGQDLSWFFDQWVYGVGAPEYEYGWETLETGGQHTLLLHVEQTQSTPYPEVFAMPVDLVVGAGGNQTVTVWNDARLQWFFLPMPAPVTSVEFDPNEWILRPGATLVNYIPGAARVYSTEPGPGVGLPVDQDVNKITISFTTNINAAPSDFFVVGAATGPVSFTNSALTNVSAVGLYLNEPLDIDTYTVTISDAVETVASGLPLDGEIGNPLGLSGLPSGDGLPGGQAVFQFSVRAPVVPAASAFGAIAAALLVLATGAIAVRSRARRAVFE